MTFWDVMAWVGVAYVTLTAVGVTCLFLALMLTPEWEDDDDTARREEWIAAYEARHGKRG